MDLSEKIIYEPQPVTSAQEIITLHNVSMGYLSGQEVLHDISLSVRRGGFYFLAGPSGAGKSSLLNIMALALKPNHGSVRLFGRETTGLSRVQLPPLRRRVGTVFQDYRLIDHLTVEENVGLPLKISGEPKAEIAEKVAELLDWVGLSAYHKARPDILSGGQKQRAAIARAVVTNPDILLADEPSGNLDSSLRQKCMYLFEALNKGGTTIVLATHDEALITSTEYPVLRLHEGRMKKPS